MERGESAENSTPMTQWLKNYLPDEYVSSVYDLSLDELWRQGRRLLLFDLDNTLVPWNHPEVSEEMMNWLDLARERGFSVCILSNNRGPRVREFADRIGTDYIAEARKPKEVAFLQAMERFHCTPEMTVMIGDQLFTDVRGGNRVGARTVLVLPISNKEWWGTRWNRRAERVILYWLRRRYALRTPNRKGEARD